MIDRRLVFLSAAGLGGLFAFLGCVAAMRKPPAPRGNSKWR
jgi:hypothetical protein